MRISELMGIQYAMLMSVRWVILTARSSLGSELHEETTRVGIDSVLKITASRVASNPRTTASLVISAVFTWPLAS